uniref:Putative secreted protein n=1 Tax=Ixodes ricinus TaxID=34613 RepID=A0A6B0UE85_IXORI
MFSKMFTLQGFAVQLILFLYDPAPAVTRGSTSQPRPIPTPVATRDAPAWETGVAPISVSASKWPIKVKINVTKTLSWETRHRNLGRWRPPRPTLLKHSAGKLPQRPL